MSDIIKSYFVRSNEKEKEKRLKFLYGNGSPVTFVKKSVALKMKEVFELSTPHPFFGLGNGRFYATHILHMQIRLKGIWVIHLCYVVADDILGKEYDVLLGHDFMQKYDIVLKPKEKKVIISKLALLRGLKIK